MFFHTIFIFFTLNRSVSICFQKEIQSLLANGTSYVLSNSLKIKHQVYFKS